MFCSFFILFFLNGSHNKRIAVFVYETMSVSIDR